MTGGVDDPDAAAELAAAQAQLTAQLSRENPDPDTPASGVAVPGPGG